MNNHKLPSGWERAPLGELVEFLDHKRVPVKEADREKRKGSYPYYGANGLIGWIDDYLFDEPLVLLAEDGGFFGSKKHPVAYKITGKTWVNNHAHVLRPKSGLIDLDYLHWFLSFRDVRPFLSGSTRAKLTKSDASRIPVTYPKSLNSQRKIAKAIEQANTSKKRREQANQMTNKVLQAVFLKMFGDEKFTRKPIGKHIVKTEVRDPRRKPDEYFKYIDITGIDNKTGKIVEVKTILGKEAPSRARRVIRKDDVIVSTVRPNLNATALVLPELDNQICSTGFCVLHCKSSLNPRYLYAFTRRGEFIDVLSSQMKGASYPAVTNNDVLNVEIPIPPIDLQNKFASIVERIEALRDRQNQSTQEITELFHSLMQRAFRGELAA